MTSIRAGFLCERWSVARGKAPARSRFALRLAAESRPAVLITGSSTGIGKTTALYLAKKGWQVFAGVRRDTDGDALVKADPSVVPVMLDVTSDASTAAAVAEVSRHLAGRNLSGLVNNAGKGVFLPLELMSMEQFEDVLAVNLTGVVRVTKAAMPLLRKSGSRQQQQPGRIVNLGSYTGTIAVPLFGAYAASKFGLEAVSDSLRYELGPKWGIRTILIKAGGVKTPIWDKSIGGSEAALAALDPAALRPYKGMCDEMMAVARNAEESGIMPEEVAAVVEEALTAANPRSRYLIGNNAARDMTLRRLLPDWLWDRAMLGSLPKTSAPLDESL
ncbi:hypothetical protein VOLCADRAFT_105200 [Volvox carteri f. nagariensis]|uniref:Uncharacterized protein n=1 Tax=Volvox carteri f. nagariensis TaxID=3068 RepID=D8TZ82_VOLCA|nr:uncharacterized protein VOLCADRAFT_105200 [Volvox carteri f. nagariensis]EFJ47135.1 hypothetical protein VOLCADRAFT_105200 [Volvox carteri f. nagariensis]|eukprot:XP_002951684.1 hypothetical protein VOLCADRAFT_105200 [Volvox carteri f. nagariensis]